MYFNAFFILTKSVRVITCCFHSVDERNYWPINLFTSCMHIYFDATTLICALNESQNPKSISHTHTHTQRERKSGTTIAIIYHRSTNRKWVFECSFFLFFFFVGQPVDLNTNPEICGIVASCLHHIHYCMPRYSLWNCQVELYAWKTFWITLSEHLVKSDQTWGDVKQHC